MESLFKDAHEHAHEHAHNKSKAALASIGTRPVFTASDPSLRFLVGGKETRLFLCQES
jgi:hypothetical protein